MAYDHLLASRIGNLLTLKNVDFTEKDMMGGRIFQVDGKMLCGIHLDKRYGDHLLMARVGEVAYPQALAMDVCLPMDFTGRPMKGYVFVTPAGFVDDDSLGYWLDQCLVFNPLAKASKK
ncbi:TfoX/Sxy family protein [Neolewinella lacunae]|uniref:RNA methyltransferase n=1 Tax=Neolewinella lacunae TaxID=1517758 RepID=A0A923PIZ8_9BACT|nr:TfoX/Sxy family protein [Neolewinella lacunae]MBC6992596.1 RNA methyltransferase [Neolewinella lacunae]MDN3634337.1 TfoX/Sxy family protein [Neolewinella lacunae]